MTTVRRTSRSLVLLAVIAIHAALLALLIAASRTRGVVLSDNPIEVMLVPPAQVPKVRFLNNPPQRLRTDVAIGLSPPLLNSSADPGPASAPNGRGSAVNWVAEARRALRAFEIRRDQGSSSAVSVSVPLEEWLPREHQAGDEFKTDSGDWIVWINADCYQVASGHSLATVNPANPAQTVCPGRNRTPRKD